MMRVRSAAVAAMLLMAGATQARADGTLFLGANTSPANRQVRGAAVGAGLLMAAFEFEYMTNPEAPAQEAPSLRMGSGNGLLQTPFMVFGFQPYVTAGAGVYRERLGSRAKTNVATNVGGGVKMALAGPLRLRVDYRALRLAGGALYATAHRVYVGLNLKF